MGVTTVSVTGTVTVSVTSCFMKKDHEMQILIHMENQLQNISIIRVLYILAQLVMTDCQLDDGGRN